MELRPAIEADFSILASWIETPTLLMQWGGPTLSFPFSEDQYQLMLADTKSNPPIRKCWMAIENNTPIGHAQMQYEFNTRKTILGKVIIGPSYRGNNYAETMLRSIVSETLSNQNIVAIELIVLSHNIPAIKTYEKLGFILDKKRMVERNNKAFEIDTMILVKPNFT